MADEYRVDLEERKDKYEKLYLFGSLRMFNSVIFIRKDRNGNWHAAIKPYTGPANGKVDKEKLEGDYPWSD